MIGPILRKLFEYGIQESDIVTIKALIDIVYYNMENDIVKLNEKREIIKDLSNYSNLKLAKANIIREIYAILDTTNLEKVQSHINNINKYFTAINNSNNLSDRKYLVLCDSIG